jgi:hypothetical protein
LNFLSCIISIFPIYQITRYELQTSNSLKSQTKTQNQTTSLKISKDELPDIYYVILDGNARNDVLINNFGFDNSQFLTELEALDFYIANCSMSNYAHTNFSITSSLEMGYLDKAHSDITALPRWDETAFVKFRRQYGYQTVIFKNEIVWSKTLDPDVIISFDPTHRGHFGLFRNINQFETMFLQTTLIRVFSFFESSTQQVDENEVLLNTKYNAEKHYFDSIPLIVSLPDPKFELMHFFSTHDPFVFTLDGSFISDASNFFQNYKDSINYTNNRILQVVQKIISYIKMNPIFILQADHGSKKTVDFSDFQRMAILNAYNYPNVDKDKFYPIISPINSFRILLNGYFYQTLPLKAGLHLYTDSNKFAEINNFTLVADQNPACH